MSRYTRHAFLSSVTAHTLSRQFRLALTQAVAACVVGAAADAQTRTSREAAPPDPALRDTVVARLPRAPIMIVDSGAPLPVSCVTYSRLGERVDAELFISSAKGTFAAGNTCESIRAVRSGRDTMRVRVGRLTTTIAIAVAIRPRPATPTGQPITVDRMPSGFPWAISTRTASDGATELYFAAYDDDSTRRTGGPGKVAGNLHRLRSRDGVSFKYDGLVLARTDTGPCTYKDDGIENIVIVPRHDAPGWRMFFSAGSAKCYGWQVMSAVSEDERNWVVEPGIRLRNTPEHDLNRWMYWPAGEGMVAGRDSATGEWWMIASTFEHVVPPQNRWAITEWRSRDQIAWRYVRPLLTDRSIPGHSRADIFAPTLMEVAPGLYRMLFTVSDQREGAATSSIWSAASLDLHDWQIEGPIVGNATSRLSYSALVGDLLYYIRQLPGKMPDIGVIRLRMP